MYVITDHQDVILFVSPDIGYQENGNPLVNGGQYAIVQSLVGGVSEDIDVPDGVQPQTHIYRDGAFAPNPAYVEPADYILTRDEVDAAYAEGVNAAE